MLDKLGRADEATACHARAVEADPRSAMALRNAALDLSVHGRNQEALALYERALAIEPESANALYGRGVCLARLDRVAEAVASFRQTVEIAPDDVEAWRDLGTCLTTLARYREASQARQQVERLEPSQDAGDQEAQDLLAQVGGEILPGLRVAWSDLDAMSASDVSRAYAHMGRGQYAEAAAAFDAVLARKPDDIDLLVDRGICADAIGGGASAMPYYNRALALDGESIGAWYNKGVSFVNMKRPEEAAAAFERMLKIHRKRELPNDADFMHAQQNLGSCYLMLRRFEEALDAFDEVLRLAREASGQWIEERRRTESQRQLLFQVASQ
jgi:tetratricopeptide (TPR) repeat protein